MNSMTGFGRATQIVDGLQCIIEIKSVNSRFLDLNIRSPKQVNSVEHSIRKCIQKTIHVNDTLRMYKNDDIRMYNFDCITDTIVEVITTCNTYTLLTVHLL